MASLLTDQAPFPLVRGFAVSGAVKRYRKVWIDPERTDFILFDLDQDEESLSQSFQTYEEVAGTLDAGLLEEVAETECRERMKTFRRWEAENKAYCTAFYASNAIALPEEESIVIHLSSSLGLTKQNWKTWRRGWRFVHLLFSGNKTILGRPAKDVFLYEEWRQKTVFPTIAESLGTRPDKVKMQFLRGVRYGGDRAALMPLTDGSGNAPRPAQPDKAPAGRKPAHLGAGPRPQGQGMTDVRRGQVKTLLRDWIREAWFDKLCAVNVRELRERLRDKGGFYGEYKKRYVDPTFDPAAIHKVESKDMVIGILQTLIKDELDTLIVEVEAEIRTERNLSAKRTSEVPLRGTEADRDLNILETIMMDGKEFSDEMLKIIIVERSPLNQKMTDVGVAKAIFSRGSRPDIILGWYATGLSEHCHGYRLCLYNTLSDKTDRLALRGLDPRHYPGLVQGYGHECIIDYGAGNSKQFFLWGPEALGIDISFALPGVGANKGGVERVNRVVDETAKEELGFVSKIVRKAMEWMESLSAGFYGIAQLKAERKKKQVKKARGNEIRMTRETFEWLIIEIINEYNLKRVTGPRAVSAEATEAGIENTRAALYRFKQEVRELKGEVCPANEDIAYHWLPVLSSRINKKTVTVGTGRRRYGAGSGHPNRGERLLKSYLDKYRRRGEPCPRITYIELPDALGAKWKMPLEDAGQFEWIKLEPTLPTLDSFGEGADYDKREILALMKRIEKRESEKSPSSKPSGSEAVRQALWENDVAISDESWETDARNQQAAKAVLKSKEARETFNMLAGSAKLGFRVPSVFSQSSSGQGSGAGSAEGGANAGKPRLPAKLSLGVAPIRETNRSILATVLDKVIKRLKR